jgi:hypothetical protein
MFTELIMIRDRDNFWRDVMHRNWDWPQSNIDTQVAIDYIINNYPSGSITVNENNTELFLTTQVEMPCANCPQ